MCRFIFQLLCLYLSDSFCPTQPATTPLSGSPIQNTYAPIIQLQNGLRIRGSTESVPIDAAANSAATIDFYEGIRYGTIKRRFEKSIPFENDFSRGETGSIPPDAIYDAIGFREQCAQPGLSLAANDSNPAGDYQTRTMSEDCLYLNVWRPRSAPSINRLRPIMVFVHGGFFAVGTIFIRFYDAKQLAAEGDVVVISIQYRLGPFGFLSAPQAGVPGNAGLHDQLLALRWIREHAILFGGDANRVTIFGESAGSWSIGNLAVSPLARGLFRRAIMQSGSGNSFFGAESRANAAPKAIRFAQKVGCMPETTTTAAKEKHNDEIDSSIVECLRTKPMDKLLSAYSMDFAQSDFYLPTYGDELLPVAPVEAIKSVDTLCGTPALDIDLLYGVNRDEGSFFVTQIFTNLLADEIGAPEAAKMISMLMYGARMSPEEIAAIVAFYTSDSQSTSRSSDDWKRTISDAFGDLHFVCPTLEFGHRLAQLSAGAKDDNRRHYYSYQLAQHINTPLFVYRDWMGVMHTEDLMYLFARFIQSKAEERTLSRDMIRAWANFARNGNVTSKSNDDKNDSVNFWTEAFSGSSSGSTSSSFQYARLNALDGHRMVDGAERFRKLCTEFWLPKIRQ